MKNTFRIVHQNGFTLMELVLFIVISGLLASTLLLSLNTALQKSPVSHQQYIATLAGRRCMNWIIGQRRMNGFSSFSCPSSTTPSFCTVPSGFSISTSITCTTLNTDTNYKTATVTIGGNGDASFTTLLAAY
jgi:type II secretory pathway pseudopilin PulG